MSLHYLVEWEHAGDPGRMEVKIDLPDNPTQQDIADQILVEWLKETAKNLEPDEDDAPDWNVEETVMFGTHLYVRAERYRGDGVHFLVTPL